MDLSYSPADVQFREATRRWLETNIPRAEPATRLRTRARSSSGWSTRSPTPMERACLLV